MKELAELSNATAALVDEIGPSLVRVDARRRLSASGVVWSNEGHIITANHVVRSDENIVVGFADGTQSAATLLGRDPGTDIALLHVADVDLKAPTWLASTDLRVGTLALALGRPGQSVQATLGVISALGGGWHTASGGTVDRYVQTDVLMYPGFSGGPLAVAGKDGAAVAGLNTSALTRGTSVSLPSETVGRVVETLLTHGHMPRGYLGVGLQPVRLSSALAEELAQESGVMLMSVEEGGPAAQAGLAQGDIIVALGGESIRNADDLQGALGSDRAGQMVNVRVVRSGALSEMSVTVGQR